jgi:DNA-binding NtrC family response regulator
LFLDEITEMPLELQVGLLGVLETATRRACLERLRRHSWPGNVRKLKNVRDSALEERAPSFVDRRNFDRLDLYARRVGGRRKNVQSAAVDLERQFDGSVAPPPMVL